MEPSRDQGDDGTAQQHPQHRDPAGQDQTRTVLTHIRHEPRCPPPYLAGCRWFGTEVWAGIPYRQEIRGELNRALVLCSQLLGLIQIFERRVPQTLNEEGNSSAGGIEFMGSPTRSSFNRGFLFTMSVSRTDRT